MLLAIDTSTKMVGVALYDGAQVLGETLWNSADYHTAALAPAVGELFDRARLGVKQLQAIAIALGPGSFTGLRVGLAFAKGIALAGHLPMIGIPTLDCLAAAQPLREYSLIAVLRAGRRRFAVGHYRAEKGVWLSPRPVEVLTFEALIEQLVPPVLLCGELSGEERRALAHKGKNLFLASAALSLRRPSFLAELAWQRWQAGQVDDPATLSPLYLHYAEAIPA